MSKIVGLEFQVSINKFNKKARGCIKHLIWEKQF